MKRGQVALEYMIILGIALFLIIPLIGLFRTTSMNTQNSANSKMISLAGTEIVSNAEKIYYQGKNTRVRLNLEFPPNLKEIKIGDKNHSLIFVANNNGIDTEFVYFSSIKLNLNGCSNEHTLPLDTEGNKEIFVESCGSNVTIYAYE